MVLVGGTATDLAFAERRLSDLEEVWSRFRPTSELVRLNAERSIDVREETFDLIRYAVEAWQWTGGLFDPTVHDAVVHAGYDRTFDRIRDAPASPGPQPAVPGCAGITLEGRRVTLPDGVRLDLGGIGKGRAADLLAVELCDRGVAGACVSVGGDVRVTGAPPPAVGTWAIAVEDPRNPTRQQTIVGLDQGGIATSSRLKRRWRSGTAAAHHLIDPATAQPASGDTDAVTVIAAQAMWAEVVAKAVVVGGSRRGIQLLDTTALAGLLTLADGSSVRTNSFERFEPWTHNSGGTSPAPAD
ncbi:MAG: FAD:protein FMN transferase [Nocardioides sp.]|uniref:FAD:protein FMN transferase n=1 Tax=Nocardioides sp. TaxID=35761 RepID=UPI0039E46F1B